MDLRYLGHACFELRSECGTVVLVDPYRPGGLGGRIRHAPIPTEADVVVVTHYHEDHGWVGGLRGAPVVVDRPMRACGIDFRMVTLPHDGCDGAQMGMSRAVCFTLDHISVLHPGDLGRLPTQGELDALGPVDLLLLPVGGKFTIGPRQAVELMERTRPRWAVPMHYRTGKVDLDIAPRERFMAALPPGTPIATAIDFSATLSSAATTVVLLDPAL